MGLLKIEFKRILIDNLQQEIVKLKLILIFKTLC